MRLTALVSTRDLLNHVTFHVEAHMTCGLERGQEVYTFKGLSGMGLDRGTLVRPITVVESLVILTAGQLVEYCARASAALLG